MQALLHIRSRFPSKLKHFKYLSPSVLSKSVESASYLKRKFSSVFKSISNYEPSEEVQEETIENRKSFRMKIIDYYDREYEIEAYDGEMLAEAGNRNGVPFTKETEK